MIGLNLISPEYKKTIKIKKLMNDMQSLFLYIMFIAIVSAIILLIARRILEDNFVEAVSQTSLISRNPMENKMNMQTNKKIQLAKYIQEDYIPWSRLIIRFSELVPENVTIESFIVNPSNKKDEWDVRVSGLSIERKDFLDFKKNLLEAEDLFDPKKIEIPIDNLIEKENIKFNINLKLSKETLTNLKIDDSY